jgi:predicted AAA+ superfamily ATPase
MKDRQILLITGLRRVGKTTLMYQLIQHLLDEKVKSLHILYFSFD